MPRKVPTRPSAQTPVATSVSLVCVRATALAAGAHDRVERLDAVDAVPEEIGMVRLDLARAVGDAAEHLAELRIAFRRRGCWWHSAGWSWRRPASLCFWASSKISIASASEPATGLSMNTFLPALSTGMRLLQMRPAVDALDQHDIDLAKQLVDRVDDLDAVLLLESAW